MHLFRSLGPNSEFRHPSSYVAALICYVPVRSSVEPLNSIGIQRWRMKQSCLETFNSWYVNRGKNNNNRNRLTLWMFLGLIDTMFNLSRGHLSRSISLSSSRTPSYHKAMSSGIGSTLTGGLQGFYHSSGQSNARSMWARYLHKDTFTPRQHLMVCQSWQK